MTPSGACSSGGSQSSAARLPAHPDDDEADGDRSGMASRLRRDSEPGLPGGPVVRDRRTRTILLGVTEPLEVLITEVLDSDQLIPGLFRDADELIKLHVDRGRIPVQLIGVENLGDEDLQ